MIDYDGPATKEIRASSFAVVGTKSAEMPTEKTIAALQFEFNLPLPNGKRFGRAKDMVSSFEIASLSAKSGWMPVPKKES